MRLRTVSNDRHAAYARQRLDHFAARCRAGGLAVTPQRMAVIEALMGSTCHPRADQIFDAVRRQYPHISLATVHRTLETLCRIGEARKVTLLHDSARYDGNLSPHHHVICVSCKRIRDIEVSGIEPILENHKAPEGFEALGWSLEMQALCADCRGKMREQRRGCQCGRSPRLRHDRPHQDQ
jgi:Fur family peroxide stress response transcriptional regulator